MRNAAAILAVCGATMAATPALACRIRAVQPGNTPVEELYRNSDTAFVVATVLNDGRTSDVALRATSAIYGRLEPTPLTLGWPGDPHYTYAYQSGYSEGDDGTVTIGCGRYERVLREVRAGQQVLARIGITRAGAQVVVRWWTLDEVRSDPRIAAWRDARNGA